MTFKKFSSTQNAPGKDGSDDKSKETAPAERPAVQPDPKPAEVTPAPK